MGYLVRPLQRAKGLLDGAKCKALENKVTKGAVLSFSRWETEAEGRSPGLKMMEQESRFQFPTRSLSWCCYTALALPPPGLAVPQYM